uniref:Uncharacterized protein n=1 Tax=Anguilla anguilla TaxID=7936 RepID=A0A0E9PAU2_ANGAN
MRTADPAVCVNTAVAVCARKVIYHKY